MVNGELSIFDGLLTIRIVEVYGQEWIICLLVGGWATPLKNMKVNWDDEIPNIWENFIIATKPPTSLL